MKTMLASETEIEEIGVAGVSPPPLIAHVILRLGIGGMENGLVNLINRMPRARYRHAIVCLDGHTDFRDRLARDDVPVLALGKRPGKDLAVYARLWRCLRRLRPAIVHTRNLPAVDMVLPAALAGAPRIVHGEHGRDVLEIDGRNRKYNLLRRALSPLVDRYVPMSRDLESWLVKTIGIAPAKVVQIYNGVDAERFHPPRDGRAPLSDPDFAPPGTVVFGTVGRMEAVKDPITLARAFARLCRRPPAATEARLVMIGEGREREAVARVLAEAGVAAKAWLPGPRDDVAEIMRGLDVFVLPSRAEGISNTILEAMACGLPVIATGVGGNPELVIEGATGTLVPTADPEAMAAAMEGYLGAPERTLAHGRAGRARIEASFTLERMVAAYGALYDGILAPAMTPAR